MHAILLACFATYLRAFVWVYPRNIRLRLQSNQIWKSILSSSCIWCCVGRSCAGSTWGYHGLLYSHTQVWAPKSPGKMAWRVTVGALPSGQGLHQRPQYPLWAPGHAQSKLILSKLPADVCGREGCISSNPGNHCRSHQFIFMSLILWRPSAHAFSSGKTSKFRIILNTWPLSDWCSNLQASQICPPKLETQGQGPPLSFSSLWIAIYIYSVLLEIVLMFNFLVIQLSCSPIPQPVPVGDGWTIWWVYHIITRWKSGS